MSTNIILKIAAIPFRSRFKITLESQQIGLEEGGDIFSFSLDNRYIFETDQAKTRDFFNDLLFLHICELSPEIKLIDQDDRTGEFRRLFINHFISKHALSEILTASAGIPRDFLNLFINAFSIRSNQSETISLRDVRMATTQWYTSDKKDEIEKDSVLKIFFRSIVEEIVIKKKKTHFLMPQSKADNKYVGKLVDLRAIHLRKSGLSHKHISERMFALFSVDYGSYTSLDIPRRTLDSGLEGLLDSLSQIEDIDKSRSIALDDDFFNRFLLEAGEGKICPHCKMTIDINHLAFTKQNICNNCYEKVTE